MSTKRITAVAPVRGQRMLDVTWEDGSTTRVDLAAHIQRLAALAPLLKPAIFRRVVIGEWGLEIIFADDDALSLPASLLERLVREQAGKAMPTTDFRDWMQRNKLSLTDAAEALGLTRRTVTYYSSGQRPIPRHIALACVGWEAIAKGRGAVA